MAKNTGKEYEKLTQYIFNQIVNQNQVDNIEVQHNVTIQGKSTTHQIDVFWKFEIGGEEYCAIVQAKDWKSKVPQKEMLAFTDIIRDLPYGTRGIFVSLSGYQKGAIDVAKANGITIYELRPPRSEDWDGYIKVLNLTFTSRYPVYKNLILSIDAAWALKQNSYDLPSGECMCFNTDDEFYDENGTPYASMESVLRSILEDSGDEVKHIIHTFDRVTFTYIDGKYVKVNSVEGDFGYSASTYVKKIDAEDFTGCVLKNIISGDSKMFDKNYTLKS